MKIQLKSRDVSLIGTILLFTYSYCNQFLGVSLLFSGAFLISYFIVLYFVLILSTTNRLGMFRNKSIILDSYSLQLLLVFIATIVSMIRCIEKQQIAFYLILFWIPLSLDEYILENKSLVRVFVLISVILVIGSLINYWFPQIYSMYIVKGFRRGASKRLVMFLKEGIYYAGFTSQVAYTSFFLCMGMGALMCFRKVIYGSVAWVIAGFIMLGMFLTSKRGPFIFLITSLLLVYFFEGLGRHKLIRVFKIVFVFVITYFIIAFLAYTDINIPGIDRIYKAINGFITSGEIKNTGRHVLFAQALEYFLAKPLWGIGWGNYHVLFTPLKTHVHNIYLQLLCEDGIFVFAIYFVFFVTQMFIGIQAIKRYTQEDIKRAWMKYGLFIQFFFLLYGITGNPLYDLEMAIFYFFAVGIVNLSISTVNETEMV